MRWRVEGPDCEAVSPKTARIPSHTRAHSRLHIAAAVADEWGLSGRTSICLRAGQSSPIRARLCVRPSDEQGPDVVVVPGANAKWSLPSHIALRAVCESGSATVRIGPVIAILTVSTKIMFGAQRGTFRDLMRVGARRCALVYAFTPRDVDWVSRTINGYRWEGRAEGAEGRWTRRVFPMPDVVYNRIPRRIDEKRPEVAEVVRRLQSLPHLTVFNARFLNKWEVQKRLVAMEELRPRIPDTTLWTGPESLIRTLNQYGQAFLKPVSSSLGNGAMRIRRTPCGYTWEMNVPGQGTRRRSSPSFHAICALITKAKGNQRYLIQRCIDLATYNGKPFDVRILVQKNDWGEWQTTGMAARVARKDRITTHIPNGGKAHNIDETLLRAFEGTAVDPEQVGCLLSQTAVMAAQAVDVHATEVYGELSLDVGVDKTGGVWIFEVNAKPFRFDEEVIRQLALRRVIGYSSHLAGLTNTRTVPTPH